MTGIFVGPGRFFAEIHVRTMLLVNGHCEQSNTIPIVFNQNGSKGVSSPRLTTRSDC
jgi:hypothetical protein